ncbi:MAG: hypothetical protein R3281_14390 [Balneolaceae bacterium]|nr:hypothetical protein [Balneolaceae bacterium]
MLAIFTGYYLNSKKQIYGKSGYTNTLIEYDEIIYDDGRLTGYIVQNGKIMSKGEHTGYTIITNDIFGPFRHLPWL